MSGPEQPPIGGFATSFVRTVTPYLVSLLVVEAARVGLDVDAGSLDAPVSAVLAGGYYAAARWLERRWPRFGWLLGSPKPPRYGGGGGA